MDKKIIIRFIEGQTSHSESDQVIRWAEKSPDNMNYLKELMNIEAMGATGRVASEEEYELFKLKIEGKKNRIWSIVRTTAACLLLLLSVGANIYFIHQEKIRSSEDAMLTDLIFKNKSIDSLVQEIYVSKGAKSHITLPDGSQVWLNSDSKISFPMAFSSDKRSVKFSGEAFFEVEHMDDCPMVISLRNNLVLEVKGTTFNVRSYADEKDVQTTLYEGSINLITADYSEEKIMKLHEMVPKEVCTTTMGRTVVAKKSDEDLTQISSWKDGILYFDNTPMETVIHKLEKWHGITIKVADESVLKYSITATLTNESAVQIMEYLRYCAPIDYSVSGSTFTLRKR